MSNNLLRDPAGVAPNPAKGESEIRAPALAARRRASRRETRPLLTLGGRLILFIQVHGGYFFWIQ
jgi:hypothetical protein